VRRIAIGAGQVGAEVVRSPHARWERQEHGRLAEPASADGGLLPPVVETVRSPDDPAQHLTHSRAFIGAVGRLGG